MRTGYSFVFFAMSFFSLCWADGAFAAGDGEKLYNELKEKEGLYPDEEWQAYVTEIGARLLATSSDAGETYNFVVVDNPTVNASATADGYIFINRGLLAYLRSEDELAGVIGHEIGHVVGRHHKKRKRGQLLGDVAGFLGSLATGTSAIADVTRDFTAKKIAGFGREYELEADTYGGEFLARAGYNPLAMIDVIQVLKDHELFSRQVQNRPTVYHGLFASHPKNDKRLHDAVQKSQSLLPETLREPERDFWEMMDGLVYGDEAATGLIKGQSYYHGSLRVVFTFPDEWVITNTPRQVIGKPRAGSSDSSITVQPMPAPEEKEETPADYVTNTLKREDVINGESLEVSGYPAFIGDIEVAGGDAQVRKIAIIFKDGGVYQFLGEVGPLGDPAAFEEKWRTTVESFRAMTAADLRVANNQRIKVIVARPSDSYFTLSQQASLKSYPEETLRVLNGHHPHGEPRAGDNIKIIQ